VFYSLNLTLCLQYNLYLKLMMIVVDIYYGLYIINVNWDLTSRLKYLYVQIMT